MEWKPRLIDRLELRAVGDLLTTVFAHAPRMPDPKFAQMEAALEVDRTFVVGDGRALVGTIGAYSFDLAVPAGSVPLSGVSWAGVLPTHRRRGILSALVDAVLDQAVEREEPLAGLTASEGSIYRRFGFGVAGRFQTVVVDTARAQPISTPEAGGRVRLISEDEAKGALPAVWDRHWRRTPGEVSRTPGWWPCEAVDPEEDREGATRRFLALHETADGQPDGYAIYRFVPHGAPDGDYHELRIDEIAAAEYPVEAALLRYLLEVDLVRQLRWPAASVDLPFPWQLADPRAVKVVAQQDHMWLRPLDVAACLAGRGYAADGGAVIEVIDRARPDLGGRFMLDASPDGADCTRTTAEADVVVGMPDLGSLYLGAVSWRTLFLAGLVEEQAEGAIVRLDNLFRPDRAPYCTTHF